MKFDLHMHSHHSRDGALTEEELIQHALAAKLNCIALCDHNTTAGVKKIMDLGQAAGIEVIPGIECDTLFEGLEVHVLGLGIDPEHPYFQNLSDHINALMLASARKRLELIDQNFKLGLDIDALMKLSAGSLNPFGITFQAILDDPKWSDEAVLAPYRVGGERQSPAPVNFYWDHCSVGKPCHVPIKYPSLVDTIKEIKAAGGIAIIAHPYTNFYEQPHLLLQAKLCGIEGLEAYSNYHDKAMNSYYERFCNENEWLITCGSDFHGPFKPMIAMGDSGYQGDMQAQWLSAIKEKIKRN